MEYFLKVGKKLLPLLLLRRVGQRRGATRAVQEVWQGSSARDGAAFMLDPKSGQISPLENQSGKPRGSGGRAPGKRAYQPATAKDSRFSKKIINCPIMVPQWGTGIFHFLVISWIDR